MSGANFGIGIGAFAQGLQNGIGLGKQLREVKDDNEIRKLTKEGMEQAKQDRAKTVDDSIIQQAPRMEQGTGVLTPAASGINAEGATNMDPVAKAQGTVDAMLNGNMTVAPIEQPAKPKGFKVGNREFDSREEAFKYADKQADSVYDFFNKTAAPKIRDAYMQQGKIEQADQFNTWLEDRGTKQGMKSWSRALTAAQVGDVDGFATNLVKAYNAPGYFDDGMKASAAEVLRDKEGKAAGFKVTLKDAEGKENVQQYDNIDDMIQVGLGMLSPQARFKAYYDESLMSKKNRLEALTNEAAKADEENARKRQDARQHLYRMDEIGARNDGKNTNAGDQMSRFFISLDERTNRFLATDGKEAYKYRKMTPEQQKKARTEYMRAQGWVMDDGNVTDKGAAAASSGPDGGDGKLPILDIE